MQKHLVMTFTGHDRPGIVEYLTKLILDHGGNVEASRMSRLGGEFAVLMLIAVPSPKFEALRETVRGLRSEDYKVTTRETNHSYGRTFSGWLPFQIKVVGADHEGIIHQITRHLAGRGVNIETMDTGLVEAPMSGTPLFTMSAVVLAPPDLPYHDLRDELAAVGDSLNVNTEVSPYGG